MKKILLGSTVLFGVLSSSIAALADGTDEGIPVPTPPQDGGTFADSGKVLPKNKGLAIEIGGTIEFQAYVESQKVPPFNPRERHQNFITYSRLYVKAYGESDHLPLNYEVRFEFDTDGDTSQTSANAAVFTEAAELILHHDNWGRIQMGDTNGVLDQFQRMAYDVLPYGGAASTVLTNEFNLGPSAEANLVAFPDFTEKATKISYRTPTYYGFRVAGDYTVDTRHQGTMPIDDDAEGLDDTAGFENVWSVLLNYQNAFYDDALEMDVVVGYQQGSPEIEQTDDPTGVDELQLFHVSAALTYEGFSLLGSYTNFFDTQTTLEELTRNENGGQGFDVGIGYETGPWSFGLVYNHTFKDVSDATTEVEDDNGNSSLHSASAGGSYELAPGLSLNGEVTYITLKDPEGVDSTNPSGVFKNDAVFGIVGVSVEF